MNHESHENRSRTFWMVFVALIALTAVEVTLTYTSLSKTLIETALLGMMAAKVGLVAAFYMHLKYEPRMYSYIFFGPVFLVVALTVFMLV